jgi:ribosomal protein S18 acetylase RimI-like enzyme
MEIRNAKHQLVVDDANLSCSTFKNVDLSASSFNDINLESAAFDDINLRQSKFHNVDLSCAEFTDCNLAGVRMNGVLLEAPGDTIEHEQSISGIRPFLDSDIPEVIALWKSIFNYSAPHNDPETTIRQKLKVDRELFIIAIHASRIVGTAMAGYDGHRGWIYSLAVHPDHRRQGIATELVKWLERALASRGCMKVNLQLLASNAETTAFYQKLGYAVEPRISMGRLL